MPEVKRRPGTAVEPAKLPDLAPVLALSSAAGAIDAIAYFELGRVFVANMTGNTVLAAGMAALGRWPDAGRHLVPVLTFLLGVSAARFIVGSVPVPAKGSPPGRRVALCLTGSGVLVSLCVPFAGIFGRALPALLAFGVGAQNAVITRVGPVTFNTAFITGDLEKLGESVVKLGARSAGSGATPQQQAGISAAIWASYFIAAAAGTGASHSLHTGALFLPALLLFGTAAFFWLRRPDAA